MSDWKVLENNTRFNFFLLPWGVVFFCNLGVWGGFLNLKKKRFKKKKKKKKSESQRHRFFSIIIAVLSQDIVLIAQSTKEDYENHYGRESAEDFVAKQ